MSVQVLKLPAIVMYPLVELARSKQRCSPSEASGEQDVQGAREETVRRNISLRGRTYIVTQSSTRTATAYNPNVDVVRLETGSVCHPSVRNIHRRLNSSASPRLL